MTLPHTYYCRAASGALFLVLPNPRWIEEFSRHLHNKIFSCLEWSTCHLGVTISHVLPFKMKHRSIHEKIIDVPRYQKWKLEKRTFIVLECSTPCINEANSHSGPWLPWPPPFIYNNNFLFLSFFSFSVLSFFVFVLFHLTEILLEVRQVGVPRWLLPWVG